MGVQPPLPEAEMASMLSGERYGLPDEQHPSDHCAVAAVLAFREGE